MDRNFLRQELEAAAETDYKKFNQKIVPGAENVLGVRLPKLREIAKQFAKADAAASLESLEFACSSDGGNPNPYFEEIMVYGLIIGYAKMDDSQRQEWIGRFRPHITNWAVCDSCCMTYKWMKKRPEEWWGYLETCIRTGLEYDIRFAVVCMLAHFMNEEYLQKVLRECAGIRHDAYYVKMAVAWAVSVCYVFDPETTYQFFTQSHLDDFTHNKSIQKVCDSFRVKPEEKQKLRALKRK